MGKLGYSSITLTDLTETLPVSLVLKSNKDSNIQTKVGSLYTPNFSEEELIITPSLFLGQEDLRIEENEKLINPALNSGSGYLYYEIGNEHYEYNGSTIGNYVDIKGNLHIKENLNKNITIKAYIQNYFNETHNYYIELISATNPINFLLMEENTSGFQAIIECAGGREFFEDSNASPITMTALLYNGKEIINEENDSRFTYIWNRLSDNSISNTRSLTVHRNSLFNRDYFTCVITDNKIGTIYTASRFLYDFTDTYTCEISYNKMPLLIEGINSEILLTAKVWDKEIDLTSKEGFNLSYEWKVTNLNGSEEILQDGLKNSYLLNSDNPQIPKEDFIILCKIYQTDSENTKYQIASNTVNFNYISDYQVKISPQTIFIPTSNEGFYLGKPEKEYSFNFQLVDRNGNLLPFETSDTITDKTYDSDGATLTFNKQENWNFIGTLNFINSNFWENSNLEGSRAYDFTYTYAGQNFTEEIYIVKSYAGQPGFSGYTIDFSNEFFTFSGGESIADPNQSTNCLVSSYLGGDSVAIKEIKIGDKIIYSKEDYSYENEWYNYNNNNLFIQANKIQDNQINITLRTNTPEELGLFLTKIEPVIFKIIIKKVDGSDMTFLKTFSYNINYNGKTYYLLPSENSIHYIEAKHHYEPEFFTVQALFRETTGLANTYENGKILYSFNGEEWKSYNERIEGYNNLQNIYLRLYGSRANINSNLTYSSTDLEEFSSYLYDTETIPILTSLEGYEFGGENLLKGTKEITIGSNQWRKDEEVSILSSDISEIKIPFLTKKRETPINLILGFGELGEKVLGLTNDTSELVSNEVFSPKIKIEENYFNKSFTISCSIYVDDEKNIKTWDEIFSFGKFINPEGKEIIYPRFDIWLLGYKNIFSQQKYSCAIRLGSLTNSNYNIAFQADENFESRKWIRIWKTFTLSTDYFASEDILYSSTEKVLLEECESFSLSFGTYNLPNILNEQNTFIKIKQPKLEFGNVPTSWSPSSYDTSYNDIVGLNISKSPKILHKITTKEPYLWFADLLPDTTYTFSFSSSSWAGDKNYNFFNCYLFKRDLYLEEDSGVQNQIESEENTAIFCENYMFSFSNSLKELTATTFHTPKENKIYSFRIYASYKDDNSFSQSNILTLEKAKIEKGDRATSFFLTEEGLQQTIDTTAADTLSYINSVGEQINIELNETKNSLETLRESQLTIDEVKATITEQTSKFYQDQDGFIKELKGKITLSAEDASEPFIQISTFSTDASFAIKITDKKLGFYEGKAEEIEPIAYMDSQYLHINSARFNKNFYIGDLLVTITETGVGFTW